METKTVSRTFNEYPDFDPGDLVKLKSGSPVMTVDGNAGSRITCTWFDAANERHTEDFDQGAIEKVTSEEKSVST